VTVGPESWAWFLEIAGAAELAAALGALDEGSEVSSSP
jgi:hypothetical protein